MLGDQSPWAGGLLRASVVASELNGNIKYFLQDLDTPWFETSERVKIKQGWNNYWSLACRYPWSFCVPGQAINDILNTTRSPRGLGYLIGPRTNSTIYSHNTDRTIGQMLQDLLTREISWADQILTWAEKQSESVIDLPEYNIRELSEYFANLSKVGTVKGFFDFFQSSPPLTYSELPESEFWHCNTSGLRYSQSGPSTFPVPKAKALILEIAARGWILGCTHIPYLEKVLELKKQYLPGLPLRLLQITFDWRPALNNPMFAILRAHNKKRKSRKKPLWENIGPEFDEIESYWRKRPSSISYHMLGGELGPRFELLEYQ